MRGARKPRPPFGWDDEHPPPRPGYRARKRLAALAPDDEAQTAAPAMQFLRRARVPESFEPTPQPTPPPKTHRAPSQGRGRRPLQPSDATAAARQRLHRERARSGRRIVPVAIDSAAEELLRAAGVLKEWDTDSREAVGHAVERLLELILADGHA